MPLVSHIRDRQNLYYLANGTFASNFEDLATDLPTNSTINAGFIQSNNNSFKIHCNNGSNQVIAVMDLNGKTILQYIYGFDRGQHC